MGWKKKESEVAGDWIKIEHVTVRKSETLQVANILGVSRYEALGAMIDLWVWADQNLQIDGNDDGNAGGVTFALLDSVIGVPGLCAAMAVAGWLEETEGGVRFVNAGRHLTQTAKTRTLTAARVTKCKRKRNAEVNAEGNGADVTPSVTREEKRREEVYSPPTPPVGGDVEIKSSNTQEEEAAWGMAHDLLVENVPSGKWPEGKNLEAAMQQVAIRLEGGEEPERVAEFVRAWGRGEIQGRHNLAAAVRDRYAGWKKEREDERRIRTRGADGTQDGERAVEESG